MFHWKGLRLGQRPNSSTPKSGFLSHHQIHSNVMPIRNWFNLTPRTRSRHRHWNAMRISKRMNADPYSPRLQVNVQRTLQHELESRRKVRDSISQHKHRESRRDFNSISTQTSGISMKGQGFNFSLHEKTRTKWTRVVFRHQNETRPKSSSTCPRACGVEKIEGRRNLPYVSSCYWCSMASCL